MLRTFAIEIGLFLTPFALYGLLLLVTRGAVVPQAVPTRTMIGLTVAALALVVAGLMLFNDGRHSQPGQRYVPAHMENGVFVPGRFE